VVGVGVGYKVTDSGLTDEPSVVVNVARKVHRNHLTSADLIPRHLEHVRTDVLETGQMRAMVGQQGRLRPRIKGGASLAHRAVSAGSLGCLVRREGELFILSNNHVIANINQGQVGDSILQPSALDGGTAADAVASLAEYVPLNFESPAEPQGCFSLTSVGQVLRQVAVLTGQKPARRPYWPEPGLNWVDAALARPNSRELFSAELLGIGQLRGTREVGLGAFVRKTGRTTGYTEGRIIQFDVTTSVMYAGQRAMFEGQLMASGMSAAGDSGAAVVDADNFVVGLLYAGSNNSTLITPIDYILQALQVELFVP
jgi:hypothetical protein